MADGNRNSDSTRRDEEYGHSRSPARKLLERALEAMDDDPEEAHRHIDRAIERDPTCAQAWIVKGRIHWSAEERPDLALPCFEKALSLSPENGDALVFRGHCLAEAERVDEAIASYDAALALDRDNVAALRSSANNLANTGKPAEAVLRYRRALAASDEPDPRLLVDLASALHDADENAEALATADRALELDEDLDEAWYCRGHAALALGRKAEAARAFSRFLALAGESAPPEAVELARTLLSDILREGTAVELDPFDVAIDLERQERFPEAVASYRRASADNPIASYLAGNILLFHLAKPAEALAEYERAAHLEDPGCLCNRGACLVVLGRAKEGLASIDSALEAAEDPNALVLYLRAWCLRRLGREKEARRAEADASEWDEDGAERGRAEEWIARLEGMTA